MSDSRRIMAIFFIQSIVLGSWFPRIPEIQAALGLGPAQLALALLGMPIGLLMTLPFAGRVVAKIGARAAIIGGFAVFLLLSPLPAFAWNLPSLFFALLIVGTAVSGLELGMNVAADAIEHAAGRKIMSTCHGFWSLGQMVGSLIGVAFAALAVEVNASLGLVSLVLLVPALWLGFTLPRLPDAAAHPAEPRRNWSGPSKALIGLCVFVFGIAMAEGAAADWSAVFLRDIIGTPLAQAGFGYTAYAFAIAAGRFLGDRLSTRFGPVMLARFCGAVTIIGIGIVVTSTGASQAMIGLAALGFGCSVGFPLGVTAAARLGDRLAAPNVALLSLFALFGFLVGAPMIGFVAQHLDLRFGLAMLLPPLLLSLALAGGLRPRRTTGELAPAAA
ncbi:MFS transporter [Mesorhizobium sp. BR1-1-16]|uniref:MFS transporter n=1 Tax=Mesorhizobium sp. BR1-1-16 TaxID=2876653 RepID=UPI001CCED7CC|nr:MFS transporter [Mesorhizobium sp. BR1-1-16]MBZ9937835.1 MFS transporter [Mesorhizobium sp. BR1-1-16]